MKLKRAMGPLVLALLTLVMQAPSDADTRQPQPPVFRGGVDLVTVNVVVHDRDGRPVTGLLPTDFELFDSGERRPITTFHSLPAPVNIAVLFDVSGSMAVGPKLTAAKDAIGQLASWLTQGRDQMALFEFDTELRERQPFTTMPSGVMEHLGSLQPFGSTSLYDAIAETGERMGKQYGPRRAVVVVTDGLDNRSRLSPAEVSRVASAIDVPVYILIVKSPLDMPNSAEGQPVPAGPLDSLARWTGGALYAAGTPARASMAARQIVAELRSQYVMTFEPSNRAGWHPLAVLARDTSMIVRARSGYVAGPREINNRDGS